MSESKQKRSSNTGCIGDIAEVNPKTKVEVLENEYVSFVSMQDTDENGGITRKQARHFAKVKKGYTRFAEDDVLVAKITPCFENGKGGYAQGLLHGVGFGSTEFHVIRALPTKADSKYLYHLTRSSEFRRLGEASMTGSAGQKRVPAEFIREYPIFIPPLPEQKKIAEILSGIDKVLLAYEKQVHKLSMSLIALRNNFITSNTSAQWAVVEDLCTAQAGGTPDRSRSEYYCGPIPWVKSGEVRGEDILQTEETITREAITNSSAKIVPAGSILVAMYGATAGQTAQLKIQAATNQAVLALNARSSKINNRYILFAISAFKDFLLMTCQGSGQPNLSAELIKNLAIPVPDLEYQNKMVMMLDAVLRRITYLRAKLSSTRSLKQAISSDLLSGRKRVTIQP